MSGNCIFVYKQRYNVDVTFYQNGTFTCIGDPKYTYLWRWNPILSTVESYDEVEEVWDDVRRLGEPGVNDCYRAWVAQQVIE